MKISTYYAAIITILSAVMSHICIASEAAVQSPPKLPYRTILALSVTKEEAVKRAQILLEETASHKEGNDKKLDIDASNTKLAQFANLLIDMGLLTKDPLQMKSKENNNIELFIHHYHANLVQYTETLLKWLHLDSQDKSLINGTPNEQLHKKIKNYFELLDQLIKCPQQENTQNEESTPWRNACLIALLWDMNKNAEQKQIYTSLCFQGLIKPNSFNTIAAIIWQSAFNKIDESLKYNFDAFRCTLCSGSHRLSNETLWTTQVCEFFLTLLNWEDANKDQVKTYYQKQAINSLKMLCPGIKIWDTTHLQNPQETLNKLIDYYKNDISKSKFTHRGCQIVKIVGLVAAVKILVYIVRRPKSKITEETKPLHKNSKQQPRVIESLPRPAAQA